MGCAYPDDHLPHPSPAQSRPQCAGWVRILRSGDPCADISDEETFQAQAEQHAVDGQESEVITGAVRGDEDYQILCMGGALLESDIWV